MKPRPRGVVRSRCGLSSTFSSEPRLWMRSMMCHAVQHRACRAVPLGDDEDVAGPEFVDGLLELGAVLDVLAGRLLTKDLVALFAA